MALPIKLFAGGAIAVGIFIIASGSKAYWERQQAQRWLEVKAVVVSSSVCIWKGSRSTSYMPRVTYAYAIGSEVYQSASIRFGPAVVNRAEAEAVVQRFPKGTRAVAYVDPSDHRRVVLDRDHVSGAAKWQIGLGLSLLVAGVILLIGLRNAGL